MTQSLYQFCQNWIAKAAAYNDDTLANHFDKFTSLYVTFNALYMDVMVQLVAQGKEIPKDFKDKKAATDYVIKYLRSKHFISNLLNDQQSTDDLNAICNIIHDEHFNIILDWGEPQRLLDLKLLEGLRSTSTQEKGVAILSLLYHVRCNMFHGHKGFEDRQSQLLGPVNRLLRKVVTITFNKLNE